MVTTTPRPPQVHHPTNATRYECEERSSRRSRAEPRKALMAIAAMPTAAAVIEQRLTDSARRMLSPRRRRHAYYLCCLLPFFRQGPFGSLEARAARPLQSLTLPLRLRWSARTYMMIAQRSSVLIWGP